MEEKNEVNQASTLLPGPEVDKRYGITPRTRNRWKNTPAMGFGPPVIINGREYYYLNKLLEFERARLQPANSKAA